MPSTEVLYAHDVHAVRRAAALLRDGGLVAFPTETVYGLGANALSPAAVQKIFAAKGRPSWDPLIVHCAEFQEVKELVLLSGILERRVDALAAAFWPGPLTLLLPRSGLIPDAVTAGRPLVGVRVPRHPVARALLQISGVPVAAPSANRFGHTSPTTAQHVLDDLAGRIDAVLDGGPTTVGVESTVLDPGAHPMRVYRAGAVTNEQISRATGAAVQDAPDFPPEPDAANPSQGLTAPGIGLRHYAPEVRLELTGPVPRELAGAVARALAAGERPCALVPADWPMDLPVGATAQVWGRWHSVESLAAELFAALRSAERSGATLLLCPLPEPGGLREALRDRLKKAARPR